VSERVAIVGSRDFPKLTLVDATVAALPADTVVISGGARGVDRRAAYAAKRRGLEVVELEAIWSQGRGAGLARNSKIVAAADRVIAFWDGQSRGTMDTVRKARAAGKPVEVVRS
jgi:hypothetical protein